MDSILEPHECRWCYECGRTGYLEEHHIFFGQPDRQHSEDTGLKVHLCPRCHRYGKTGVHGGNRKLDLKLKAIAQKAFEQNHTRAEFMNIFGRNYLEEPQSEPETITDGFIFIEEGVNGLPFNRTGKY